jgi:hypothetical protein
MVAMPLDRKEMTRLVHLLGMTGSDLDTEALTFLRGAQKLVRSKGETWESLLAPLMNGASGVNGTNWHAPKGASREPPPEPERRYKTAKEAEDAEPDYFPELRACLERGNLLTAWERDFVTSLLERDWPRLTEKQQAIVDRIQAKLAKYKDMAW